MGLSHSVGYTQTRLLAEIISTPVENYSLTCERRERVSLVKLNTFFKFETYRSIYHQTTLISPTIFGNFEIINKACNIIIINFNIKRLFCKYCVK